MKTITLQIKDSIYERVVKFLQLSPADIKIVEKDSQRIKPNIKEQMLVEDSNINKVMEFAGIINNKEALRIKEIINKEFNKIEGEW
ncbi:MAG: hypothetical protein B6D61_01580 [Bacteroidetes bacterium 4484_249]|nr:MAG: hypothetical protein B6D61_01580 [Bacteroidetes bacterium 4484_249]